MALLLKQLIWISHSSNIPSKTLLFQNRTIAAFQMKTAISLAVLSSVTQELRDVLVF